MITSVPPACLSCGTEIIRKRRESQRYFETRKYCSLACWHKVPKPKGRTHPSWKGGIYRSPSGYLRYGVSNGKILVHRAVMEQHLGRKLTTDEIVHHKNGIKDDNRFENLEVVLRTTHFGEVACPNCQHIFKIK